MFEIVYNDWPSNLRIVIGKNIKLLIHSIFMHYRLIYTVVINIVWLNDLHWIEDVYAVLLSGYNRVACL